MKKKKLIPFAFLGSLLMIVIFIFGVQYGKKVAQIDKTIQFLISITPTKAVTPSPVATITYTSYDNKECGVTFLYPSNLKEDTVASWSGSLKNKAETMVNLTCEKNSTLLADMDITKTATASLTIENKDIIASKSGDIYIFALPGKNKKIVHFTVSSSLLPLIEKTLKVTK